CAPRSTPTAAARACCSIAFHCKIAAAVPDHDFLFALEMSGDPDSGRMLGDLGAAGLGHVGYSAPAIAELTSAMSGSLTRGGARAGRRGDDGFLARAGEWQIVVACAGAAEWGTTRPLPAS